MNEEAPALAKYLYKLITSRGLTIPAADAETFVAAKKWLWETTKGDTNEQPALKPLLSEVSSADNSAGGRSGQDLVGSARPV